MASVKNLVHMTSDSTGSGNLAVAEVNGKQSFEDAFGTGATTDVFDYFISNRDGAEWERGTGHMSDATTLVRDTILESSNSNLAVTFTFGTKDITNDVPANKQWYTGITTLASAATVDLGSVQECSLIISGSATISSFGSSAPAGTVKFLSFTGAPTLANSANIVCPANANMTLSAGRTLAVRHNGSGVWLVMPSMDGTLTALSDLTTAADKLIYATGVDQFALTDLTTFGRSLIGAATAAAAATLLALGTADSPQFAGINVGHATDTTITRVSAGVIAVEGVTLLTTNTGQPLDAELTAIAGLTSAADSFPYFTGPGAAALATIGSAARTFLATPSSANLAALVTDETGSGLLVFGTSPTLSSPTISGTTSLAASHVFSWNSGDVTETHSANTLTWAGASSGYIFQDGLVRVTAGTSTSNTDFLQIYPSDTAAGKPYLAIKKNLTATDWTIGLWDGSANTGNIAVSATAFNPGTNGGVDQGTTSLGWGNIYLAAGKKLDFGSGDITQTAGTNSMTWAGASSGYFFNNALLQISDADATAYSATSAAAPRLVILNSNTTANTESAIWFQGTDAGSTVRNEAKISAVHATKTAGADSTDLAFVLRNAGTLGEKLYLTSAGVLRPGTNGGGDLGNTSVGWGNIYLAATKKLDFGSGDITVTHATDQLDFAGAATGYTFSGGNVGIGLTSMKAKLDILGTGSGTTVAASGTTDATMNLRVGRGTVGVDTGTLDSGKSYIQVRSVSALGTTFDLLLQPTGGNVSIGTASPDRKFHVEADDATTNATTYVQRLTHTCSATATTSFGVGIEAELENASGTNVVGGTAEWAFTDATNGSEDVEFVVKLMTGGAAAAAQLRISSLGALTITTIELGHASDTTLSRSSAGVLAVEGVTVSMNSTSATHTAGTIELGHASDTTLSRSSAGILAVEGVTVPLNSTTNTHTCQQLELGHASDTTLTRSAAGELAVEGTVVKKVGKETIWIPAAAMTARTTNGAASGTTEMATNKNMFRTLDFDTTTQEFAQFEIFLPKSWNLGTVTFRAVWSHAATVTNFGVQWGLQAVARSDADAGDVAFGTEQVSTDTGGTTNAIYISPESAAITIAGTPAAGDTVQFQIKRNPSDANDTLAVDARLHGIQLFFTTSASTDA
jgi:hypothetical protein